jgi:hypothetical protein
LGGANPVFFLLASAQHLAKRIWPLGACAAVRFLRTEGLEAANNRSGTRAAAGLIARKVSKCFKNPRGAEASAASVSVLRTVAQTVVATTSD